LNKQQVLASICLLKKTKPNEKGAPPLKKKGAGGVGAASGVSLHANEGNYQSPIAKRDYY